MSSNSEFHATLFAFWSSNTKFFDSRSYTTTLDFSSTAAIFILCRDMSNTESRTCTHELQWERVVDKNFEDDPVFQPQRILALLRPAHDFDVPDHRVEHPFAHELAFEAIELRFFSRHRIK